MEQGGKLISWNDAKGFGFIQPDDGSERVFAHISVMRGDARPVAGMAVRFVGARDAQGRLRAEHMRGEGLALDRPAIRRKPQAARSNGGKADVSATPRRRAARSRRLQPVRRVGLKLGVLTLLCALPLAGGLQLWLKQHLPWPLLAYLLVSIVSFIQYAMDKRSAETGRWRTPENTLHITELLGGWPGALVAQQVFRHKTRKLSFQVVFWLIVGLHQLVWLDRLVLGGRLTGGLLPF
ncbi:DUF1294 domain-containing protein [Halopseudomonas maritima]|uniref:DUF1294 domain-containing protein n=1 Tax=Halopseudomonas maritima TaxID=2918528 RepID=UPI001EEA7306|nr:DUF1294 domain-containing protein [Halopseudomonas maritima]UJJ33236.1 DUF1294 domain-containing protein [Halopseudomonas maritima]